MMTIRVSIFSLLPLIEKKTTQNICTPSESAYLFVGNLDRRLTEGDVITIFSQYGEVLDINLPRTPEGGLKSQQGSSNQHPQSKPGDRRGFGFLLYEDQRSTVLAVDNLNGFALLGRTLRVDHVREYRMPGAKKAEEEGQELQPSRNAAPQLVEGDDSHQEGEGDIDLEDPMAAYFASTKKRRHEGAEMSKEEKKAKKEERRRRREEKESRRLRKGRSRRELERTDEIAESAEELRRRYHQDGRRLDEYTPIERDHYVGREDSVELNKRPEHDIDRRGNHHSRRWRSPERNSRAERSYSHDLHRSRERESGRER